MARPNSRVPAASSGNPFLNCRDWRAFLAAAQCAVAYPMVIDALRSGPNWLLDDANEHSNWLLASGLGAPRL